MPYSSKKTGKNEITVNKKDSGKVVGHTTPEKYKDYMAALHIHSGDQAADGGVVEEKESPIIEKIRDFMLQHNGLGGSEAKEADVAMNVDTSSGTAKGYAKGGIVTPYPKIEQELDEEGTEGSTDESNDPEFEAMPHLAEGGIADDFSVDGGDSDTLKGLPLNPAAIPPQPPPPIPMPQNVPPKPMMAAPAAPAAAPRPLPGMPPSVTPDELQGYLNKQRAAIGKYSPDRQYDQETAILNARNSPLASISHAVGTFAGPEYAKAQDDRWQNLLENTAGATERARKGTMEQVEANQKIDATDPKSPLSMTYQKSFAPIFKAMGYSPNDVMGMPASQIQTLADLGVRYADAQTQLELKKAMLQVQTLSAMANIQNQRTERAFNEKKLAVENPIKSKINELLQGGGRTQMPSFETEDQAHAAKLPSGTIVTIGGRRARID